MRSWLFAPGDSNKKMEKATGGPADIVLIDLEDAVADSEKVKTRDTVADFISANPEQGARLWVRINPLQSPWALGDLAVVMRARPGGIMLPKARGRADVETLDHYLSVLEVAFGAEVGSTKVITLLTETAESMFTCGDYAGAPRLAALSWGAEDLADSLGASSNRNPDGSYGFTFEMARSFCLMGAVVAGVPAIETVESDFRNEAGLRERVANVRRAGFRGMLAIHPSQVEVINEGFMPSAEDLAAAQEIVDLFAANPGVGAIGHKGSMVDRPHLARARQVLAAAGRA